MNAPASFSLLLRITGIRYSSAKGIICAGLEVDFKGNKLSPTTVFVVKSYHQHTPKDIAIGEWYEIYGGKRTEKNVSADGYKHKEIQIDGPDSVVLQRPSGEHIVQALADNPKYERIGVVKARKLWDTFGDELFSILDSADVPTLAKIINPNLAQKMVDVWQEHAGSDVYRFFQKVKFPLKLARRVYNFHGQDTLAKLQEDPYRLLSFTASWKQIDEIARSIFGVAEDDHRRLMAAIEEALYSLLKDKHTCASYTAVKSRARRILGKTALVTKALALGKSNGAYVYSEKTGLYHSFGAIVIEKTVAEFLAKVLQKSICQHLTEDKIIEYLKEFESIEELTLNPDQRAAVHICARRPLIMLTGGAGTGKTTTLKALYYVLSRAGYPIHQVALSGRASQRMAEVTGRHAMTIAKFINHVLEYPIARESFLIIDEASMVDIMLAYRMFKNIAPDLVRIVFVGDAAQLPPIGPGLLFHVLVELGNIPKARLSQIMRQDERTGIPVVSRLIREGRWPDHLRFGGGVTFIANGKNGMVNAVLDLYHQSPGTTQVITPTNALTTEINSQCVLKYTVQNPEIMVFGEHSGFREGDRIMYTENNWSRGILNGALGRIIEVFPEPKDVGEDEPAFARAEFEGGLFFVFANDIFKMALSYSITLHKAQGSQFERVIVPVLPGRLMDRTFVYTAITRAEKQVILIGDEEAGRKAVCAPPKAQQRNVALGMMLQELLSEK